MAQEMGAKEEQGGSVSHLGKTLRAAHGHVLWHPPSLEQEVTHGSGPSGGPRGLGQATGEGCEQQGFLPSAHLALGRGQRAHEGLQLLELCLCGPHLLPELQELSVLVLEHCDVAAAFPLTADWWVLARG